MSKEFILECPGAHIAATYYLFEKLDGYKKFTINNLTGCMGLICVLEEEAALLVHDASDGYPHAKEKLSAFLSEHKRNTDRTHVVWTAGHTAWHQSRWIAKRIPAKNILFMTDAKSISWAKDSEESLEVEHGSRTIPRGSNTLRQLTPSDGDWQRDSDAQNCPICNRPFSFFHRKHHCRNCGRVVCSDCSDECSRLGPQFNHLKHSVDLYCSTCVANSWGGKNRIW